jgi:hypothetical protein
MLIKKTLIFQSVIYGNNATKWILEKTIKNDTVWYAQRMRKLIDLFDPRGWIVGR